MGTSFKFQVETAAGHKSAPATIELAVACLPTPPATVLLDPRTVDDGVYSLACALAGITLGLSFIFLVFNIARRKTKFIRLSTPLMNNLVLIGVMLGMVAVFFLRIDQFKDDEAAFNSACASSLWLVSLSFIF